jgi:hypothetical protein
VLKSDSEVYEVYPDDSISKIVICRLCAVPFMVNLRNAPVIDGKCYIGHQTYKPANIEFVQ